MRDLVSMKINERLNDAPVLILLVKIETLDKLENLDRLSQKVICYALSIKNFNTCQEIVIFNFCIETYYVVHLSWVHVQNASYFDIQNL
jgi:hypothetical protein